VIDEEEADRAGEPRYGRRSRGRRGMAEQVRWAGQIYTVGEKESQRREEEKYVQPGEWEDGKCETETECVVSNILNEKKE
jgi:hypothetical protein